MRQELWTAWLLPAGALGLFFLLAGQHATTAEPLTLGAWTVLGAMLAGMLGLNVGRRRALETVEAKARHARFRRQRAEASAAGYRAELDDIRKRSLGELADAVQALLVTLQERGHELEEEENWWKHGGQHGDE